MSFFNNLIIIPIGVIIKKNMAIITIGAIIEPSSIPNLTQSLFGNDNTLGATKASNKNTALTPSSKSFFESLATYYLKEERCVELLSESIKKSNFLSSSSSDFCTSSCIKNEVFCITNCYIIMQCSCIMVNRR